MAEEGVQWDGVECVSEEEEEEEGEDTLQRLHRVQGAVLRVAQHMAQSTGDREPQLGHWEELSWLEELTQRVTIRVQDRPMPVTNASIPDVDPGKLPPPMLESFRLFRGQWRVVSRIQEPYDRFKPQELTEETPLFELYDPLGEWEGAAETTLCHRRLVPPMPLKPSLKFITSLHRLALAVGDLEPLFCSLAIWDVKAKAKLSENFYFHLNSKFTMDMLPDVSPSVLETGFEFDRQSGPGPAVKRAMFSVSDPNPHIALILQVDKVLQGTSDSSILRAYTSNTTSPDSKDYIDPRLVTLKNCETCSHFGLYRQPFLWSAVRLFHAESELDISKTKSLNLVPIDTSLLDHSEQSLVMRAGMVRMGPLYQIPSSEEIRPSHICDFIANASLCEQLKTVAGELILDITPLRSSLTKTSSLESSVQPMEEELDPLAALAELSSHDDSSASVQSSPKSSSGSPAIQGLSGKSGSQRRGVSPSHLAGKRNGLFSDNPEFNQYFLEERLMRAFLLVEEFPTRVPRSPYFSFIHELFLYPRSCRFQNVVSGKIKPKNVLVKAVFRESDDWDHDLETMAMGGYSAGFLDQFCSKEDPSKRSFFAQTQVWYNSRNPNFTDEFRISLPIFISRKYHVLFLFYHIHEKRELFPPPTSFIAPAKKTLLGYSFLPVFDAENGVLRAEDHNLPVFSSLQSGYLDFGISSGLPALQNGRPLFHFQSKLLSTVYPNDLVVSDFYESCQLVNPVEYSDRPPPRNVLEVKLASFREKMMSLRSADFNQLIPYLPVLFNLIFSTVSSLPKLLTSTRYAGSGNSPQLQPADSQGTAPRLLASLSGEASSSSAPSSSSQAEGGGKKTQQHEGARSLLDSSFPSSSLSSSQTASTSSLLSVQEDMFNKPGYRASLGLASLGSLGSLGASTSSLDPKKTAAGLSPAALGLSSISSLLSRKPDNEFLARRRKRAIRDPLQSFSTSVALSAKHARRNRRKPVEDEEGDEEGEGDEGSSATDMEVTPDSQRDFMQWPEELEQEGLDSARNEDPDEGTSSHPTEEEENPVKVDLRSVHSSNTTGAQPLSIGAANVRRGVEGASWSSGSPSSDTSSSTKKSGSIPIRGFSGSSFNSGDTTVSPGALSQRSQSILTGSGSSSRSASVQKHQGFLTSVLSTQNTCLLTLLSLLRGSSEALKLETYRRQRLQEEKDLHHRLINRQSIVPGNLLRRAATMRSVKSGLSFGDLDAHLSTRDLSLLDYEGSPAASASSVALLEDQISGGDASDVGSKSDSRPAGPLAMSNAWKVLVEIVQGTRGARGSEGSFPHQNADLLSSSRQNSLLSSYVQYIFDNQVLDATNSTPFHEIILEQWLKLISCEPKLAPEVLSLETMRHRLSIVQSSSSNLGLGMSAGGGAPPSVAPSHRLPVMGASPSSPGEDVLRFLGSASPATGPTDAQSDTDDEYNLNTSAITSANPSNRGSLDLRGAVARSGILGAGSSFSQTGTSEPSSQRGSIELRNLNRSSWDLRNALENNYPYTGGSHDAEELSPSAVVGFDVVAPQVRTQFILKQAAQRLVQHSSTQAQRPAEGSSFSPVEESGGSSVLGATLSASPADQQSRIGGTPSSNSSGSSGQLGVATGVPCSGLRKSLELSQSSAPSSGAAINPPGTGTSASSSSSVPQGGSPGVSDSVLTMRAPSLSVCSRTSEVGQHPSTRMREYAVLLHHFCHTLPPKCLQQGEWLARARSISTTITFSTEVARCSHLDLIEFSWFFFDIVVKSISLFLHRSSSPGPGADPVVKNSGADIFDFPDLLQQLQSDSLFGLDGGPPATTNGASSSADNTDGPPSSSTLSQQLRPPETGPRLSVFTQDMLELLVEGVTHEALLLVQDLNITKLQEDCGEKSIHLLRETARSLALFSRDILGLVHPCFPLFLVSTFFQSSGMTLNRHFQRRPPLTEFTLLDPLLCLHPRLLSSSTQLEDSKFHPAHQRQLWGLVMQAEYLKVLADDRSMVALALLPSTPIHPPPGKEPLLPSELPQLPDYCVSVLLLCLRSGVPAIQSEGITLMADVLASLELNARHTSVDNHHALAFLFLPMLNAVLSEVDVVQQLRRVQQRDLLMCVAFVLRNLGCENTSIWLSSQTYVSRCALVRVLHLMLQCFSLEDDTEFLMSDEVLTKHLTVLLRSELMPEEFSRLSRGHHLLCSSISRLVADVLLLCIHSKLDTSLMPASDMVEEESERGGHSEEESTMGGCASLFLEPPIVEDPSLRRSQTHSSTSSWRCAVQHANPEVLQPLLIEIADVLYLLLWKRRDTSSSAFLLQTAGAFSSEEYSGPLSEGKSVLGLEKELEVVQEALLTLLPHVLLRFGPVISSVNPPVPGTPSKGTGSFRFRAWSLLFATILSRTQFPSRTHSPPAIRTLFRVMSLLGQGMTSSQKASWQSGWLSQPFPRAGQGIVLLDQLMCSVWGSDDQRVEEFHARAQMWSRKREPDSERNLCYENDRPFLDPPSNSTPRSREGAESKSQQAHNRTRSSHSGEALIHAATVDKLIERLTAPSAPDSLQLKKEFLLTYRAYITPRGLLRSLMRRYVAAPELCESAGSGDTAQNIRIRVIGVLKAWVGEYFHDFDAQVLGMLGNFLDLELGGQAAKSMWTVLHKQLQILVESKLFGKVLVKEVSVESLMQEQSSRIFQTDSSKPELPPDYRRIFSSDGPLDVLQWSAAEIARQMTLIEFAYFSTLQPREFFNLAWTRRNKHSQAPNIMRCTDHFNRMAQFVATTIVNEPNLRKRAAIFTKWIDVADYCRTELHNYPSVYEIYAALNNSACYRLHRTKAEVPRRAKDKLNRCAELMSPENFHAKLQAELQRITPPFIPYIGMYMTLLVMMDGATSDCIYEPLPVGVGEESSTSAKGAEGAGSDVAVKDEKGGQGSRQQESELRDCEEVETGGEDMVGDMILEAAERAEQDVRNGVITCDEDEEEGTLADLGSGSASESQESAPNSRPFSPAGRSQDHHYHPPPPSAAPPPPPPPPPPRFRPGGSDSVSPVDPRLLALKIARQKKRAQSGSFSPPVSPSGVPANTSPGSDSVGVVENGSSSESKTALTPELEQQGLHSDVVDTADTASEAAEDGVDVNGRRWMVNVRKCRRMAAYITTICNFNQEPYSFEPVPWLLRKLLTVEVLDEGELYNRSCEIEPRASH